MTRHTRIPLWLALGLVLAAWTRTVSLPTVPYDGGSCRGVGLEGVLRGSELGMSEVRTEDAGRFALVEWANARRALLLSMDAVQDYSVNAEINRTDVPRPTHTPIEASDFIGYDVTALLAHNDRPHAGLGDFGAGSRSEVQDALAEVMREVRGIGMLLLSDSEAEWQRLGNMMAERVRTFPARPPGFM